MIQIPNISQLIINANNYYSPDDATEYINSLTNIENNIRNLEINSRGEDEFKKNLINYGKYLMEFSRNSTKYYHTNNITGSELVYMLNHDMSKRIEDESFTVMNKNYICVDIETTSLIPQCGDIIELFIMIINNGKAVKKISHTFKSDDAYRTYHIHQIGINETYFDYGFADPEYESLREEIKNLINLCKKGSDYSFMAQYAPFELSWFKHHLGINPDELQIYDTRQVEKILYPEVSHSLIPTCERRNIKSPNGKDFHRASWDVEAMWLVAKQQFEELKKVFN